MCTLHTQYLMTLSGQGACSYIGWGQWQSNRILIGQDLEQVPVVPAGLLAPGGDAALGGGLAA